MMLFAYNIIISAYIACYYRYFSSARKNEEPMNHIYVFGIAKWTNIKKKK